MCEQPETENGNANNCVRHDLFTILSDLISDSLIDNLMTNSIIEILSGIAHISFMSINISVDIRVLLA